MPPDKFLLAVLQSQTIIIQDHACTDYPTSHQLSLPSEEVPIFVLHIILFHFLQFFFQPFLYVYYQGLPHAHKGTDSHLISSHLCSIPTIFEMPCVQSVRYPNASRLTSPRHQPQHHYSSQPPFTTSTMYIYTKSHNRTKTYIAQRLGYRVSVTTSIQGFTFPRPWLQDVLIRSCRQLVHSVYCGVGSTEGSGSSLELIVAKKHQASQQDIYVPSSGPHESGPHEAGPLVSLVLHCLSHEPHLSLFMASPAKLQASDILFMISVTQSSASTCKAELAGGHKTASVGNFGSLPSLTGGKMGIPLQRSVGCSDRQTG